MTAKSYRYFVHGRAAGAQTFQVDGSVLCEWHEVFDAVMRDTFAKLTSGKAVFGQPGVGCKGPYDITNFHIKQNEQ